jgi:hypothetical protein
MLKNVTFNFSAQGKGELKQCGLDEQVLSGHIQTAIDKGIFPYKFIFTGLYKGDPCLHAIYIEKTKIGMFCSVMGFISELILDEESVIVTDIQEKLNGLSIKEIDILLDGDA